MAKNDLNSLEIASDAVNLIVEKAAGVIQLKLLEEFYQPYVSKKTLEEAQTVCRQSYDIKCDLEKCETENSDGNEPQPAEVDRQSSLKIGVKYK